MVRRRTHRLRGGVVLVLGLVLGQPPVEAAGQEQLDGPTAAPDDSRWRRYEGVVLASVMAGCFSVRHQGSWSADSLRYPDRFELSSVEVMDLGYHALGTFETDIPGLADGAPAPVWRPVSLDSAYVDPDPNTGGENRYNATMVIDSGGAFTLETFWSDGLPRPGDHPVWGRLVGRAYGDRVPCVAPTEADQDTVEVELFAPDVVSSALPEFATSFTPSGDTVFFNRTPPDRSRLDLYYAVRVAGQWGDAEPFPGLEGATAIDPFVSLDGERLYFSSDREGADTEAGAFNLWWVALHGDDAQPVPLPRPINSDSSEVFNSFSRDGRMVFSSRRDGLRAIYEVLGGSGQVSRVTLDVGGDGAVSNPAIHPDGRLLVFASAAERASSDLFVACRTDVGWGTPRRLPHPINTPFTEFAPGFGPSYLYFSSERPGIVGPRPDGVRPPGDVYRVRLSAVDRFCRDDPSDGQG